MKRLPHAIEQKLLAILADVRAEVAQQEPDIVSGPLDQDQACRDFAGCCELLPSQIKASREAIGRGSKKGALYLLTKEVGLTFHHHTKSALGRTAKRNSTGGRGAEFIRVFAKAAGVIDPRTKQPYTLKKCASAIKELTDALSEEKGLPTTGKYTKDDGGQQNERVRQRRTDPARKLARAALLKAHQIGEDEEGWPIIGGYEPAPDRSRTVDDRIPRDVLDRLIADSKVSSRKPKS